MKRKPDESFDDYKIRRKMENKKVDRIIRWILPKSKPKPMEVFHEPSNPAIGKRHKDESLDDFRMRRKLCNTQRRQREGNRKLIINMADPIWRKCNQHMLQKGYALIESIGE